ncbi:Cytochrome c-type biogenesis protein CcmE [compost metagenome]
MQGKLGAGDLFVAREVLAKHDENYMPAEAADALKRAGNANGEIGGRVAKETLR